MVGGARSTPFIIDTEQPMSLLSVWFKPGGALPFFGISGDEVYNCHLHLEIVWGHTATDLYEQLRSVSDSLTRFRILEGVLLQRLRRAGERHRAVLYALDTFSHSPRMQRIGDVVEAVALSPTRFIQVFREDVGMTPKQFCRVQRFQRALRMMATNDRIDQVDVALACGYYDQSHFINDFRALAGITPSAYAPQSREHNTNLPVYES